MTITLEQAAVLHARGELDAASNAYEHLRRQYPADAGILIRLGLLRLQQDRLADAEECLDEALALEPSAFEAHAWRGEVFRKRGDTAAAIEAFHTALRGNPDFAPALFNLGIAQADAGNDAAAREAWLKFLRLRPDNLRVRRELGTLAYQRADYAEAASWFTQQLQLLPGQAEACCDLASVLLAQREWDAAASLLGRLVAREPGDARAGLLLGKALLGAGRTLEAAKLLVDRARKTPLDAELAYQTGRALDQLAQLPDAIQWFIKAASLAPERADVRNALAVAYINAGSHTPALEQFRKALVLKSDYIEAHSNLLMALHYPWPVDLELIFAEHVRWAKQHAGGLGKRGGSFAIRRTPRRRLNIAYLSPRFCAGALATFFIPVLGAHDHERFNITCYSLAPNDDAVTRFMRERAEQWRECADMDDRALLDLIRNDAIDIVVDLVGHSPGNRLHALSDRAAPLQMTWLDYVDTSGLAAMDYFISDRFHTPLDSRQRFVEELIRLPDVRLCYQPQEPLPNFGLPRTQKTRAITFGSFNRISKYGDAVIDAWAKILAGTPRSRLVLKATALSNEQTRELMRRRFSRHGIASSRLDLRPFSDPRQMMHEYNDVDIVLDPFPFNGGTTTCDALSMGRPVVTLEGVNIASRQGVAILNVCGMSGWVTKSLDDYVGLAIQLAADVPDPARANEVRDTFLASPICDAPRFTRNLEAAYMTAWQRRLDLDR